MWNGQKDIMIHGSSSSPGLVAMPVACRQVGRRHVPASLEIWHISTHSHLRDEPSMCPALLSLPGEVIGHGCGHQIGMPCLFSFCAIPDMSDENSLVARWICSCAAAISSPYRIRM